ncbi:MAG: polyphenol oxidase family protein [Halobacteriovoraceae bacterium]|nr:polyphenol oxidase family protein [Halobacteriovoraceae bacterium]
MNSIYEEEYSFGKFQTFSSKPEMDFYEVKQVHGNKVVCASELTLNSPEIEADGIICYIDKLVPMCIKTADCTPLLIKGELGVAMLHVGWKSLNQHIILQEEIRKLRPQIFLLGPHISQENYEVSEDFKLIFPDEDNYRAINNKLYFSLHNEISRQIKLNFDKAAIYHNAPCTYSNPLLHSFRKNKTDKRNYNLFIPRN